jgi:hypothetical protein
MESVIAVIAKSGSYDRKSYVSSLLNTLIAFPPQKACLWMIWYHIGTPFSEKLSSILEITDRFRKLVKERVSIGLAPFLQSQPFWQFVWRTWCYGCLCSDVSLIQSLQDSMGSSLKILEVRIISMTLSIQQILPMPEIRLPLTCPGIPSAYSGRQFRARHRNPVLLT